MLTSLHIRNFAIVPSLEQEFFAGFTAISGETGAGKSILVDALGLLLGARSDSAWVRAGEERAELSAEFDISTNTPAAGWLKAHELEAESQCLLRRTIRSNGRSNAWINGTPVTVQQLAELGNLLVEVHGQNEHVRLTGRRRQLELLDDTGSYGKKLLDVSEAWTSWLTLENRINELQATAALPPAEAEFLGFQLRELQDQVISAADIHALEADHRLLSNAEELLSALGQSMEDLDHDQAGLTQRLSVVLARLEPVAELDEDISEARRMLEESLINAQESIASLSNASARVSLDPDRLDQVTRQLSALGDLARKHGVDMEKLTEVRDAMAARLEAAAGFEEELRVLGQERQQALEAYSDAAVALTDARQRHAKKLANKVQSLMGELGMEGGQLQIDFVKGSNEEPSELGDDRVDILVSANAGMPPASLAKVASGGELSRISLAIKVATASSKGVTQVFDEIDAGVGGDTANAVGRLLSQAASSGQALCVTHLAQVAVRADQQLQVMKDSAEESTSVDSRVLGKEERIEEIARMLGGTVSDQSRAHAREMLDSANSSVH